MWAYFSFFEKEMTTSYVKMTAGRDLRTISLYERIFVTLLCSISGFQKNQKTVAILKKFFLFDSLFIVFFFRVPMPRRHS